jgi:hypothetical protein
MAIDPASPRSRRALLVAALGAGVATVAGALGRPQPARAGVDGDVVLGTDNAAVSFTKLTNSTNNADVLGAESAGGGTALYGHSTSGYGLYAFSTSGVGALGASQYTYGVHGSSVSSSGVRGDGASGHGVYGYSTSLATAATLGWSDGGTTGIEGYSGPSPVPVPPTKTGVYGYATQDANARGVYGRSTAGRGVYGQATSGTGVYGYATSGYALRSYGRIKFDKASGVATILSGNTVVLVSPGLDVTTASFVLLTPKGDLGSRRLWYTTDTSANTVTIRVSSAVASDLKVGWLLVG